MLDSGKTIMLIPAYEPDEKLVDLVKTTSNKEFMTIVVNDGSGPAYDEIFKEVSRYATVLRHSKNLGKGQAIKTGLIYIKEKVFGKEVVCTLDSDGQHEISDAIRVAGLALENPDSLVIGQRSTDKENGAPLRSRLGNSLTRLIFKLSTGVKVTDTQTGLRAFSLSLIDYMLNIEGSRYEYEMNVIIKCAKDKIEIREVPIKTIYVNNNSCSHFKPFFDSVIIYKDILKFSISSFVGFLTDVLMFIIFGAALSPLGGLGLVTANIFARIISSSVNFTINRKLVFKDKGSIGLAALKYFALAGGILIGNTLLLTMLVGGMGFNKYFAKIITEIVFFLLSFIMQKHVIFRKKEVGVSV